MYTCQISCLLMFWLLSFVSSTGKSYEENIGDHFQATVKLTLQVLHVFYKIINFFFDIISFQHVLHFDVGRSEIGWNMKLKWVTLVFT